MQITQGSPNNRDHTLVLGRGLGLWKLLGSVCVAGQTTYQVVGTCRGVGEFSRQLMWHHLSMKHRGGQKWEGEKSQEKWATRPQLIGGAFFFFSSPVVMKWLPPPPPETTTVIYVKPKGGNEQEGGHHMAGLVLGLLSFLGKRYLSQNLKEMTSGSGGGGWWQNSGTGSPSPMSFTSYSFLSYNYSCVVLVGFWITYSSISVAPPRPTHT